MFFSGNKKQTEVVERGASDSSIEAFRLWLRLRGLWNRIKDQIKGILIGKAMNIQTTGTKRKSISSQSAGIGVLGFALHLCAVGAPPDAPPNVIFILTDDLGYGELSCYGQEKLQTPNMDRLADEGIKFTDFYAANTVCSPSRFSLMTGQHAGHANCRGNSTLGGGATLDPKMTTLANVFKAAGYATGLYGKWGLGHTDASTPENPMWHGFDEFYCYQNQGAAHNYYPAYMVENGEKISIPEGTYIHDVIVAKAFDFISKNTKTGTPFFCYMTVTVPHAAMHAPEALHEKWRKVFPQFDNRISRYGGKGAPPVTNPIAGFAAMMENFDNQVGQLLDMLKTLGIDHNTLIVLTSDNGAHNEGGHDPEFWNSTGPFRGLKRDLYEGGIRVPFLARWPGEINAGSVSSFVGTGYDVLPTMAELLQQPAPEQCDGISLLPVFKGETATQPDYRYWEFWAVLPRGERTKENLAKQSMTSQAVRSGKWKAFRGYAEETRKNSHQGVPVSEMPIELYDLDADPGESRNLAAQFPEVAARMLSYMEEAHTPLL